MSDRDGGRHATHCFADGVLLSLGTATAQLRDLCDEREVEVSPVHVSALEALAEGAAIDPSMPPWADLIQAGYVRPGAPAVDPVIRGRLKRLGQSFLDEYETTLTERERRAYDRLLDAHGHRKRFFEQIGQCPVVPETALRRALWVGDAATAGRQRWLCVGDDDLVSVALATLGHAVTVYDIDPMLIRFLRGFAKAHELDITVEARDLCDPFDPRPATDFDGFMTDPMSNRECLELFLSRALALTREGGCGYCAAHPPVRDLLRALSEEIRFDIQTEYHRHNRYYDNTLHLHDYESDWFSLRKRSDTEVSIPIDDYFIPLNLYREDFYIGERALVAHMTDLEEPRFAMPYYLELLLETLRERLGASSLGRTHQTLGETWTTLHADIPGGHLVLHVDRAQRCLSVDIRPHVPEIESLLRQLLLNAYKTVYRGSTLTTTRFLWDVRFR